MRLLGGFGLSWGEMPLPPIASQSARSLFAYLITHRDRPHTRALLAGIFWPDLPDYQARRRLSQALWQIGRVLQSLPGPTSYLLADAETVQFNATSAYWLDVEEFEKSADQEAVVLYRGDFLAGFYDDWMVVERERLREQYLAVLGRLLALCKREGAYEEALGYAHRLVAENPLGEEGHREVMRLCFLLGRRGEAAQQYECCRAILAEELGIEPAAATTALHREIAVQGAAAETPYLPQDATQAPASLLEGAGPPPLVGRAAERAALVGWLEQAGRGHGGLALLEGEAGIGKTRLLEEVARDARWRGVQVLWGHAGELAGASPYGPLREALRAALSPLRVGQLAQMVSATVLRDAALLLPELAAVAGPPAAAPSAPALDQSQLLQALSHIVLALGQLAPHLLILEDLHWADEDTFSALKHLAEHLPSGRVLVIGSYRSGEARARPPVWGALQALDRAGLGQRIELAPLSLSDTRELVRRALGLAHAAPFFAGRLHQETAGNPLFILETLRSLHDERVLYRDRTGAWSTPWDETTVDYVELPLPAGVRQVIARRLARLAPAERAALNAAAVLGAEFDLALLLATSDFHRGACVAAASELVRRGLLEERPAAYRFSHDQVRRVAYAGLAEPDRQALHRRAGEALEAQCPQGVAALAFHFAQAGEAAKALHYHTGAGEEARAVYAGAEAIRHYEQALAAWARLQSRDWAPGIGLHLARGEVCQETGRFAEAEGAFRAAHDLAVQAGDSLAQAAALNGLSYLCFERGEYRPATEFARSALVLSLASGRVEQLAAALLNQANALRNLGNLHEAVELYQQAAAHFVGLDDRRRLADCLCRMGAACVHQGRYAEAQAAIERSLVLRRQLDDRVGISYSLTNLTVLYNCLGDFDRALAAAQEAYAVASAVGDPSGQDAALHNAGLVILEQGDLARAMPMLEQALAIGRRIGDGDMVTIALMHLGRAHAGLGDLARAQALLEQSRDEMIRDGYGQFGAEPYAHLAGVLGAMGRWMEAQAAAANSLDAAQAVADPWVLGLAHRVVAEVAAQAGGGVDLVQQHFAESLRLLRAIGARAELARTLASCGLYLLDTAETGAHAAGAGSLHPNDAVPTPDPITGDPPKAGLPARHLAAAYLDEARALFERAGMAGDLARLDRALAVRSADCRITLRLPRAGAPTGRPLREDEWVEVAWTVAAAEDAAIAGKAPRRQHRLLRLLREAEEQGAAPTVDDLAAALGASRATIKRDLAGLRGAGQLAATRGQRVGRDTSALRSG